MVGSQTENRKNVPQAICRLLYVECRGKCCLCHETPIQEIHHIVPVSSGGSNAPENLAPVCASCHKRIHSSSEYPLERVKNEKESWIGNSREILFSIITSGLSAEELIRELQNFYRPKDPAQVAEFRKRLLHYVRSPYLFNNFVNIRRHWIRKDVDDSGDCWTWEEQTFRPFFSLDMRTIPFNGISPVKLETTRFKVRLILDNKQVTPQWQCAVDDPNFKLVAVMLPRAISPNEHCTMRYEYFWPSTWELPQDIYTYDVLAWIEEVEYKFSMSKRWLIESVETAGLDVLGYSWESVGEVSLEGPSFRWSANRLPLFTSCTLTHRAVGPSEAAHTNKKSRS